jgi:hypothetical protein
MEFEREYKESDVAAKQEAKSIVRAMKNGVSFEDVFHVAASTVNALRSFCLHFKSDAYIVLNALEFRIKVQGYVDRLIAGEDIGTCSAETEEEQAEAAACATAKANRQPIQGEERYSVSEAEAQGLVGEW